MPETSVPEIAAGSGRSDDFAGQVREAEGEGRIVPSTRRSREMRRFLHGHFQQEE
jgi:hypothetical protein